MLKQSKKQKLRKLYQETKRNANDDFDKVTHERMKKIYAFANKECEDIVARNQFESLEEVTFYRDKFKAIVDIFNESIQQGYRKSKIQNQVKAILSQIFSGQPSKSEPMIVAERPLPPKESVQSYIENKSKLIIKSKIGFRSVLDEMPYTHKKIAVKPRTESKVGHASIPDNTEEIKTLRKEIDNLKKELQDKQSQKAFNIGALQSQKKEYEDRIEDLCRQVEALTAQNMRLKEGSVKSFPVSSAQPDNLVYEQEIIKDFEEYNPYKFKYRENDLNKIQNKQEKYKIGQRYQKVNPSKSYNYPIKEDINDYKLQSENLDLINEIEKAENKKNIDEIMNASFYKFNKSEANNDSKTIAIKSKISFFKPSMIIHRGDDFQIAVKSTEVVALETKRISIYINNKSSSSKPTEVQYKFDPAYYELNVTRKLSIVERNSQGKEEVVVKFINSNDLDSLIEAKLKINNSEVIFLLPAMFLQFLEKRPILDKNLEYSKQKVTPITQFSSLHSAVEFIRLEKLYGQHYESGRAYAISKNHEGYIYFRWQNRQLEIETIHAWRLFLGYLMLRDY